MMSILYAPAPGPCNVTHDIQHCPTWQGRLTCTNPTWGTRLYKFKMSARAVRVLKSTRVVLGFIEGDPDNDTLQFAVSTSYNLCLIFLLSFRAIGAGREGAWLSE